MGKAFKVVGFIVLIGFILLVGVPIIDLRTDEPVVSFLKFDQLQKGMTYEEIVDIIGEEGTVVSDSSTDEEKDGETKTTVVFEWKNGDFSGMRVSFKDGRLTEKSQTELD